jgi:hypothetical protein
MRQIPLSASLLTFIDEIDYTEAALLANEETAALAKPFTHAIADWESAFKAERQTRREVTRADAVVAVRNAALDSATTKFGVQTLAEAGGDRSHALFRRFFTVAPSVFVRQPLRKQAEHTLNVIVAELGKLEKDSPLKIAGKHLQKLAQAALDALDARSKSKGDRATKSNEVDEWKEGVNTLRTTTYAELLKHSAEKGYGKAWASAFFRDDASARASAASGDEPAPPADAPAPAPKA